MQLTARFVDDAARVPVQTHHVTCYYIVRLSHNEDDMQVDWYWFHKRASPRVNVIQIIIIYRCTVQLSCIEVWYMCRSLIIQRLV